MRSKALMATEAWKERSRREGIKYRTAKRAKLSAIKMARGCADCGYRKHPEALDFDHLRDKKFSIGSECFKYSWAALMEEIAKCDVVCANCHRIRTFNNRTKDNPRGQPRIGE